MRIFKNKIELIITLAAFLVAYGFIFWKLDISLVFLNNTVTGGDTASHVYIPYYLKDIFPLLKWWSPDWYSGFPFLYFYPPLLYLITVILSFFISLDVAFKLVIFSAVLIFPLSFFLGTKWFGFKFPIPQIATVFSIFLIFLESYSIYGGNLASLLAGQFSHTVSIGLLFMFLGLLHKGIKESKYLVLLILLGAAVMLAHPLSGIMLIASAPPFIFVSKNFRKNISFLGTVYLGIFLLSAFFTLGLVWYQSYTGIMEWSRQIVWTELFPPHWLILDISAAFAIIFAFIKKDKRAVIILWPLLVSSFLFLYLDGTNIWNTRFLPYILFIVIILASYFFGSIIQTAFRNKKLFYIPPVLALFLISWILVSDNTTFAASWFKWNFKGYQAKDSWNEAEDVFEYLKKLPKGRVMWEFNSDYDKYGSNRTFETIPVFANQPTYEGLLIESSIFGPFHFINQYETSKNPTGAIAGFDYPGFDFSRGVKHLQMSGAKYFIAYTEKVKQEAELSNKLTLLKEKGPFNIYQLEESSLVETVPNFRIEEKNSDWIYESIEWYKSNELENPIVFVKNDQEREEIRENIGELSSSKKDIKDISTSNSSISFQASEIGVPHIVKISYFPNWEAEGAKGPYLISPSYMMVIPTQESVSLHFEYGFIDWVGYIFLGGGVVYLLFTRRVYQLGNKILKT